MGTLHLGSCLRALLFPLREPAPLFRFNLVSVDDSGVQDLDKGLDCEKMGSKGAPNIDGAMFYRLVGWD